MKVRNLETEKCPDCRPKFPPQSREVSGSGNRSWQPGHNRAERSFGTFFRFLRSLFRKCGKGLHNLLLFRVRQRFLGNRRFATLD